MSLFVFDRRALWLPLALPVIVGLPLLLANRLSSIPEGAAILIGPAFFLVGAAYVYAIPYLLLLLMVYRRVPSWSSGTLRRAFWGVPLLLSLCAPLYLAANQMAAGSARWWEGCGEFLLTGCAVAYGYALAVAALGAWLAARSRSRDLPAAAP